MANFIIYWFAVFFTGALPAIALAMILFALSATFTVRLIIELAVTALVSILIYWSRTTFFDFISFATHIILPVALILRIGDRLGRALMRPRSYSRSDAAHGFRKFLRYGFVALFVICVVPRLTSWFPFTFFFMRPEQDACEFGSVTNAEYRDMLSRARSLQRWAWLPLNKVDQSGSTHSDYLEDTITEIAGPAPSFDRKVAASHAVHRALGAIYLNDNYTNTPGQWSYTLAVPRLGVLSALPGNAWLPGGRQPQSKYTNAIGIRAIAHFPNILDIPPGLIPDGLFRYNLNACPKVAFQS